MQTAGRLVRIRDSGRCRRDSPYDWLCAIGGLAYLGAVGLLRWRG